MLRSPEISPHPQQQQGSGISEIAGSVRHPAHVSRDSAWMRGPTGHLIVVSLMVIRVPIFIIHELHMSILRDLTARILGGYTSTGNQLHVQANYKLRFK
jgi:hypothetical protein